MARDEESIPQGRVARTAKVGTVIGTQGARYAGTRAANVVRSKERATEQLDKRHLEAAERMVETLGTMKGAAMKIGQLASFIDTEFLAPGLDAKAAAEELKERVLEELDYEYEAQNQRTFARAYRGHPFIYVPDVITRLSRRRVLVTEWVDGRSFDAAKELPQEEKDRIAEIIYRFYYGSIYHLQHFNADAHPGNYLLMEDGKVAFLDFGMTKQLDKEQIELEIAALEAAFEGDPERLRAALQDLGFLSNPKRVDAERVIEHVKAVGGWYMEGRKLTIDSAHVMR